jgi:hypothetical protein
MKPFMKYSFSICLRELSLFPTTDSRGRFCIIVKAIEEKPEHRTLVHIFGIYMAINLWCVEKKSHKDTKETYYYDMSQ